MISGTADLTDPQAIEMTVLIIGGAVAGAALALFLQKAGIRCDLYEANPFVEGVGGGLGLAPDGTRNCGV